MWSSTRDGSTDPTVSALLHQQLASAVSTMGDAQYWEESISPASIRQIFVEADPSNNNHTPNLLRGMKWLLASISKGRDVSEFYPHVVKLVGAQNLSVRLLVYLYLVQYADHDDTTRELSLLSINSFQRGLSDAEQLIRARALRVLTSIRLPDILQIQILGVQKALTDRSPYVRKCACQGIAKLAPRVLPHDPQQANTMIQLLQHTLDQDTATMVLSAAIVALEQIAPQQIQILHKSFRKICHLLTDMDEWGQIVAIDVLARYCRIFFREPKAWKQGSAEIVDRERRVRRTLPHDNQAPKTHHHQNTDVTNTVTTTSTSTSTTVTANGMTTLPPRPTSSTRRIQRRVVKKGFYSDEEDESTEEEVEAETILSAATGTGGTTLAHLDEDAELAPDHRLLLQSSLPLLKSRNAGVVMAVCSLHYYCGIASIPTRAAMGRALVRIHRDRREIQYVVLSSIRTLVTECPSAFSPFLNEFFVKALDPPFTRLIKLDILTSLALDPTAIATVLRELRTYIQSDDQAFAGASIQAVGKIVELARIVFDRHGRQTDQAVQERAQANKIALDCLYGLVTMTLASDKQDTVSESVLVMQRILQLLLSPDASNHGDGIHVADPNGVQDRALRRILVLLVHTLNARVPVEDTGDDDEPDETKPLGKVTVELTPMATASALWILGEILCPDGSRSDLSSLTFGKFDADKRSKLRCEMIRLLCRAFLHLEACEKDQAINFASKLTISRASGVQTVPAEGPLCENLLSMGRLDTNVDVRDRARFDSGLLHVSIGLQFDTDAMDPIPESAKILGLDQVMRIFLDRKPASSVLSLQENFSTGGGESGGFRFGTLSSLVGHRARDAYHALPPWAKENSPDSLREPPEDAPVVEEQDGWKVGKRQPGDPGEFYESSSGSSSSSDSESDSESSDSSSSSDSENSRPGASIPQRPMNPPRRQVMPDLFTSNVSTSNGVLTQRDPFGGSENVPQMPASTSSSDDESSESSDSSSSSTSSSSREITGREPVRNNNLLSMDAVLAPGRASAPHAATIMEDLQGLKVGPVVKNADQVSHVKGADYGRWNPLVRPDLAGGLSVQARYLRGSAKAREGHMLGLTADNPTVVIIQIRFENQKKDGGIIRRIRLVQKAQSSTASAIGPKKVVVPPEIAELQARQMVDCCLGLDFSRASDRQGSLLAKFDIQYGGLHKTPVDISPTVGDILLPCGRTVTDFDAQMGKLQGFQRVETTIQSLDTSDMDKLMQRVLDIAAFTVIGKSSSSLRFAGMLPASSDVVYVKMESSKKVIICSENALAVNSLMGILKKGIVA